jgi:hypothetical protein
MSKHRPVAQVKFRRIDVKPAIITPSKTKQNVMSESPSFSFRIQHCSE